MTAFRVRHSHCQCGDDLVRVSRITVPTGAVNESRVSGSGIAGSDGHGSDGYGPDGSGMAPAARRLWKALFGNIPRTALRPPRARWVIIDVVSPVQADIDSLAASLQQAFVDKTISSGVQPFGRLTVQTREPGTIRQLISIGLVRLKELERLAAILYAHLDPSMTYVISYYETKHAVRVTCRDGESAIHRKLQRAMGI
jgi:hypothetical protein